MAVIVEDGSIVANANSYVSEAELTTYATDRGLTISGDETQLLIKAMDYIESLQFIGIKSTFDQPLQWPRADVVIDDYLIAIDEIPKELKKGQYEVALAIDSGQDPLADIPRLKNKVTVGEISVEYAESQATTLVRKISNSLYKLLGGSKGGIFFKVGRG